MSAQLIHKAVVTEFITEVFGRFSGEQVPALVTEDFCAHAWGSRGAPDGARHIEQVLTRLRAILQDPRVTVLDLLAEGDRVAARYLFEAEYVGEGDTMDVAGERIRLLGILISRLRGERIAECWWEGERLAMLAQVRAA